MIGVTVKGSFKNTDKFLMAISFGKLYQHILEKYAKKGVAALSAATPVDTGKTAASWYYEIVHTDEGSTIYWKNSNVNKYVNIAMLIQYGHATRNGGYVTGVDYINPALRPIFDQLAEDAWKEVTRI